MQHLRVISSSPHPNGSPALVAVRDYIVKELNNLGITTEVQGSQSDEIAPGSQAIQNIIGRLKGTQDTGKAIMLVAHYDTVVDSYGACDDGAAVASLLETARALKAGPGLPKDILFLITDGEENGLWGAKAFMDNPAATNVELVLNFDARGCRGPVFMFETSDKNGWLVREFGKASPRPFASSLMYDIHKALRYFWTDFTVFKRAGMSGLNFAFVDDPLRHHTPNDNFGAIDERSIQHQGSYALALTQHFGKLDKQDPKTSDAIYFDVLGSTLLVYPRSWVVPLAIGALILFLAVAIPAWRQKRFTLRRAALGCLALLASILCSSFIVRFIWEIQRGLHPEYNSFTNFKVYLLGFVAIAFAVTSGVYLLFNRRVPVYDLAIGTLFVWLIITVAVSLYVPSASYVFIWPFLFSLGGIAIMMRYHRGVNDASLIATVICAVPAIILIGDTIYIISLGLGLSRPTILIALTVLLGGLLVPHVLMAATPRRLFLPAIFLLLGIICLAQSA